jgi:serine protease AprX
MIRPILLLSFFIAFTANNIAQERQYRIWFNDKPESVHSVDEPAKFLSEQAIAHREKQNIPIDSTDLPIDPVRLKKLSELGARILATSKWLNTATIALTDTTDLSAIASLSFVKKYESLGVAVQPVSNLKKRQKQIESESENPYGDAALQIEVHNGDELHRAGFTGKGMTIAVIDGGFFNADRNPKFDQNKIVGNHDFIDKKMDFMHGDTHGSSVLSTMLVKDSSVFIGTAPDAAYWLLRSEDTDTEYPAEEDYWVAALEYADSIGADVITSSLGYSEFDDSRFNHTWDQLDGKSAFISQAAAMGVQKGLLIVVSAGNEGGNNWGKITFPGDVDGVLTVGAVSPNLKPAYFSGRGFTADGRIKPDIMGIGATAATITPEGNTAWKDGTSFSAPIIAGLTACLRQALPDLSAQEIVGLIKNNSSQSLTPDSVMGYGIPDFYAAYRQGTGIEPSLKEDIPLQIIDREGIPVIKIKRLPIGETSITLHIYTLEGVIIQEYNVSENSETPLYTLKKGIYILAARCQSNYWTQKIQRL